MKNKHTMILFLFLILCVLKRCLFFLVQALLAVYTRLLEKVPIKEYTTALLRDLAEWKLCGKLSEKPPPGVLAQEYHLPVASIVTSAWGRMSELQVPPTTAAVLKNGEEEEHEEAANGGGSGPEGGESAKAPDAVKPPDGAAPGDGTGTKTNRPRPAKVASAGAAARSNGAQVATFPVGSHVRTKSGKNKKALDDQRGEIKALMNKKAKVMLLTGKQAGY
jgi:hypothetical protein